MNQTDVDRSSLMDGMPDDAGSRKKGGITGLVERASLAFKMHRAFVHMKTEMVPHVVASFATRPDSPPINLSVRRTHHLDLTPECESYLLVKALCSRHWFRLNCSVLRVDRNGMQVDIIIRSNKLESIFSDGAVATHYNGELVNPENVRSLEDYLLEMRSKQKESMQSN